MDILREVSEEELSFVIAKLKENWHQNMRSLNYLASIDRIRKLAKNFDDSSDRILPVFYTHRSGDRKNCTLFGITGLRDHCVWYITLQETLEEIQECLVNTKLIHWDKKPLFLTILKKQTGPVLDVIKVKKYNLIENEDAACYMLEKKQVLKFDLKIPDIVELRPLVESDSVLCNSIWPYRYDSSEIYIRSLIRYNGGFGLADKNTGKLLSFGLVNDFAIGILNTLPEARGKHLGELIVKLISRKIVDDFDVDPTCYISNINTPSVNLFSKLGFKKICECNWISAGQSKEL